MTVTVYYSKLILRSPVRHTDQLCSPVYSITREPGDCVYTVVVVEGCRQSVPGDRLEVPVCGVIVAEVEARSVTEARLKTGPAVARVAASKMEGGKEWKAKHA